MVETSPILRRAKLPRQNAFANRARGPGQLDRGGRRAELIVDDREPVALAGQAKHGEQKVVAVRAVDPTGAKDEVAAAGLLDGLLAGELACAIDIQRIGSIGLNPGLLLLPSKT